MWPSVKVRHADTPSGTAAGAADRKRGGHLVLRGRASPGTAAEPIILAVGALTVRKTTPTDPCGQAPSLSTRTARKRVSIRIVGAGAILPQLRRLVEEEAVGSVVDRSAVGPMCRIRCERRPIRELQPV